MPGRPGVAAKAAPRLNQDPIEPNRGFPSGRELFYTAA